MKTWKRLAREALLRWDAFEQDEDQIWEPECDFFERTRSDCQVCIVPKIMGVSCSGKDSPWECVIDASHAILSLMLIAEILDSE